MKKFTAIALMAASLALSQVANAGTITGDVNYFGDFSLAAGATGFNDSATISVANAVVSDTTNFDFVALGMNFPDLLTHATPIDIDPPVGAYSPLWSWTDGVNTVEFYLTSYTVAQRTATDLDLDGVGYFLATGYDQTPGTWNLSAQLSTGQVTATYSASSVVPTATPEPGTLALLGLGLLGLGAARRRRV